MTKTEYLIELAVKIQSLTDKPAAIHEELKGLITFYQEMIEDKIEDGMTEEEAVAAMESPDEIAARLKSELEEEKLNTTTLEPEENTQTPDENVYAKACEDSTLMRREYAAEGLNKILIEDENSGIKVKFGNVVAVNSYDNAEGFYEVTNNAGVLLVKYKRNIRNFFRLPIFRKKRGTLVLEVPRAWGGYLYARTSNAKIEIEAEISEILLRTSNAGIDINSVRADKLRAVTSNGKINAVKIGCSSAELVTSNGKIYAEDARADELLKLSSSNGPINVYNIVTSKFSAATSNSGINVDSIEADDISLATSNGNITGTLPGKQADYAITSRTVNGKNKLPDGTEGTKKLSVRTSNGKITIDFPDDEQ